MFSCCYNPFLKNYRFRISPPKGRENTQCLKIFSLILYKKSFWPSWIQIRNTFLKCAKSRYPVDKKRICKNSAVLWTKIFIWSGCGSRSQKWCGSGSTTLARSDCFFKTLLCTVTHTGAWSVGSHDVVFLCIPRRRARDRTLHLFARTEHLTHGLINDTDTKAKSRHVKNLPVQGLCGRCLSVWGPLPSYDPIPPSPYTLVQYTCILNTYSHREGGGSLPERRLEGKQLRGRKYQHDRLYHQQCCGSGSGSTGSTCFWASRIRIRIH